MDYYERKFRGSGFTLKVCWYAIVGMVAVIVIFGILTLFSGCKSIEYVEVPKVVKDTTYIVKNQKDSVWLHDSIHVKEKGDTVLIEKWHTQWKERLLVDTVYKSKTDSIFVVKTIEKKQELSWWQKLRMTLGTIMIMFILAAIIYGLYRAKKAFLP